MRKNKKSRKVEIDINQLSLLCLAIDYLIEGQCKDMAESLSVEMQKKFKFDTHIFRLELNSNGIKGAI